MFRQVNPQLSFPLNLDLKIKSYFHSYCGVVIAAAVVVVMGVILVVVSDVVAAVVFDNKTSFVGH